MTRPGERFREQGRETERRRGEAARMRAAQRAWADREAREAADRQVTLREAFYRRHPELGGAS